MELIAALAEAQKCQEATLEEMKKKLEENQMKVDRIVEERQTIATELDDCKQVIKTLEYDKEILQKELEDLLISSQSEIDKLKATIENKESELEKLISEHKEELNLANTKLNDTEIELAETLNKIEESYKKQTVLNREFKKLKSIYTVTKDENCKIKSMKENLEKSLQEVKMELLKVTNNNDRLVYELKWAGKQIETYKQLWENVKQEKDIVDRRNDEFLTNIERNRNLEKELKELKINVNNITKNNQILLDSIRNIRTTLLKDTKTICIQTDMTGNDLSKYEHLDREATLLVIGLREELVAAKDELIKMRNENDSIRNYACETRRQLEVADEEQRVERLEQTVKSLAELVNGDINPSFVPTRYPPVSGSAASNNNLTNVMDALEDVKKDLALLKTRSWHRVIRANNNVDEMPTRDRASPRRINPSSDYIRSVRFN